MSERIRFRTPWLDQTERAFKPPASARGAIPPPTSPGSPPPVEQGAWMSPPQRKRPMWCTAAFFLFGLFTMMQLALTASGDGEAAGGLVAGLIVLVITYYVARSLARRDDNPQILPIIMGGLCLKLIGTYVRYKVSIHLYKTGDFIDYDAWGRKIATSLRHGHLIQPPGRLAGTNFIRVMTGYMYALLPARMMSGFVIYGFLSFVGLLFFWRAYRIAISPKHDTTYLQWLVLLPSLIYWPSAIGKDAFMVLCAGVAAYGAAYLLTDKTVKGLIGVSAGVGGMIMVRPHFALATCGGLALAFLLRRQRGGFFRTILALGFVVAIALFAVQAAKHFFGISALNQGSIEKQLQDTSSQTSEGGSAFHPVIVNSPIKFPLGALTVIYRPLPYEAHTSQTMATALEDMILLIVTIRCLPRILRAIRKSRNLPYLLYAIGALLVFIIVFSGFSNFGILARQRAVIQPLFLVFLSLPRNVDELIPPEPMVSSPFGPPRRELYPR
jgi:hypothetical protein